MLVKLWWLIGYSVISTLHYHISSLKDVINLDMHLESFLLISIAIALLLVLWH